MVDESKPPSLGEWIRERAYRRLGIPGLVLLAVLGGAVYAYTHWKDVKEWPGVSSVVVLFTRAAVPTPAPDRFTIMVAHLENDANREHERLIVEALKEYEGIRVRPLDRTIPVEGQVPEEMEKSGHETARDYLKQSGASALIWGTVLSHGGKTISKLYWTSYHQPERKVEREPRRYDAPRTEAQFRLPEVFWEDLSQILQLVVAAHDAGFGAKEGHYMADHLAPFVTRVRTLVQTSADRPGWDATTRGQTRVMLANALVVLGEQTGKSEPLIEAVAAYKEALKEYARERVPLQWAMTQNNLGIALRKLGARLGPTGGNACLSEAVLCHDNALSAIDSKGNPVMHAKITSARERTVRTRDALSKGGQ